MADRMHTADVFIVNFVTSKVFVRVIVCQYLPIAPAAPFKPTIAL